MAACDVFSLVLSYFWFIIFHFIYQKHTCVTFERVDRFWKLECLDRSKGSEKIFALQSNFDWTSRCSTICKNFWLESVFYKYWIEMRSNQDLAVEQKCYLPSWHLFWHTCFQNRSTQSNVTMSTQSVSALFMFLKARNILYFSQILNWPLYYPSW